MLSRKDFIIDSLRIVSAVILASTTGYLLFREESTNKCDLNFVCGNCNKFNNCKVEQAEEKRRKMKSEKYKQGAKK